MERVTVEEARALAVRAFRLAGVGADIAGDGAEALLLAEMMGIPTHGLARVPLCVARLRAGGMDPSAVPDVTAPAPALRLIDARHALGPGAAMQALRHAIEAARETGLGGAFLRNATHLGALSPLLWTAAEAGFACIVTSNTTPMLAPPGGRAARVGNSPLGIGLPHAGGRHVLLDMALTVAARSKVRKAAQSGEAIPETWATDAEGRPTTDARAAMAGLMQAIGGAKGAALAVTLDLLAATLAGAAMLSEIPDTHADPAARPGLGQMILAIDARALIAPDALAARIDAAAAILAATPPAGDGPPPRLPGARALAALETARAGGIDLPPALLSDLRRLAG